MNNSFIHLVVCLTTGPKPLPKRALHIARSRDSSFKWEYPLLSLRSSISFLRLLPCLPVTSIPPCIFPSVTIRHSLIPCAVTSLFPTFSLLMIWLWRLHVCATCSHCYRGSDVDVVRRQSKDDTFAVLMQLLYPEMDKVEFLRNVGEYLPEYTASHHRG